MNEVIIIRTVGNKDVTKNMLKSKKNEVFAVAHYFDSVFKNILEAYSSYVYTSTNSTYFRAEPAFLMVRT